MALNYFDEFCKKAGIPSSSSSVVYESHKFASKKITNLRRLLQAKIKGSSLGDDFSIIAVGSYGRHEASDESDLDVYTIFRNKSSMKKKDVKIKALIREVAREVGVKFVSRGFQHIFLDSMEKNIGGKGDTNSLITNRILLLMESEYLYNRECYNYIYKRILDKYLKNLSRYKNKKPRFLINDLIRYYRTICVDYEYKVNEENKDWATRNIKLRYSRKGLYVGGVLILLNSINKRVVILKGIFSEP